jgi:hypothetical protein
MVRPERPLHIQPRATPWGRKPQMRRALKERGCAEYVLRLQRINGFRHFFIES